MSSQESTASSSASDDQKGIRAINKDTVHRICSGQVVLSLAIAIKELVENALDAGATTIEVRLREYGSELIEVVDNGSGVEECNIEALTLKHHTSKLRDFSDLSSVATLGFRGEALSSLCALSDLTIVTRHSSVEIATKVEYDNNGHIKSKTSCARQIGTTVTLSRLFESLPVRHKEFMKNIKREFTRMCNLLYAYCIVADGVRIICTNQLKKGARTTVVATQGSPTPNNNILSVFGIKQLETLIPFVQHEPDEKSLEEFSLKKTPGDLMPFMITGLISRCSHGSGRSTNDRQFYYINSRPCEPTKIMRIVNEVYRHFNGNQYPFVFLNITTEQSQVDVNVTPDKRQIFMEKEKLLLATIKTSLLEMFKDFPSTYKMQNLITIKKEDSNLTVSEIIKKFSKNGDKLLNEQGVKRNANSPPKGIMKHFFDKRIKVEDNFRQELSDADSEDEIKLVESFVKESFNSDDSDIELDIIPRKIVDSELRSSVKEFQLAKQAVFKMDVSEKRISCTNKVPDENIIDSVIVESISKAQSVTSNETIPLDDTSVIVESITFNETISLDKTVIETSEDSIENLIKKASKKHANGKETVVKFRSEITDRNAEQELQKQISKDMFERMTIVGQFNKGFIITMLDSDLFIIDQHATDEKYNFEMLQQTTVLDNQKLVNPKPLDLTAANECTLIENLEIFRKNGFSFNIDENAEPRHKVSLTAIPTSKNYQFGKEDIDEILFMLQEDSTPSMCRPSRVREMFASRACRKSVMVGSVLSKGDMRRLVDHMGQIEQPWNCPHGRPTMRHLINLDLIQE